MVERLFPGTSSPAPVDDVTGIIVGHFLIEQRIGSGGMGTVFLARDERLQRPVALKVLAPHQTADPGSVQRFQNEARSAARLDHDHIARVFFYGEDQGLHYIAYEFVQGTNLREIIRVRGRLDPAEIVSYAAQLAAALCHTSASGVVHRDIKPSNIIVTPQGKAKLVDLGLARKESLDESAQLTVAGTTLGTFDYISPEQAKDPRGVDVRSDIYSLGCTLYHALTGEPPYPEGTVLQRLLDHQDKPPPDPVVKNRRVSPALSAVIRKMMAGDPRRRYGTAEELLHDLLIIANTMGLRSVAADGTLAHAWPTFPSNNRIQLVGWSLTAVVMIAAVVTLNAHPELVRSITGQSAPEALQGSGGESRVAVAPRGNGSTTSSASPDESQTAMPHTTGNGAAERVRTPKSGTASNDVARTRRPNGDPADGLPPSPPTVSPFDDENLTLISPRSGIGNAERPETAATGTLEPPPSRADTQTTSPSERNGTDAARLPRTAERPASTEAPAERTGPFVAAGKPFDSLDAACAEIREQGTIELNFDGRFPTAQRPLRLINKRLTIQAAKGRQPVLWFAPKEPVADAHQSRMIYVSGGTLSLVNVGLELHTPDLSNADLWALLSCARPERLRLQGVTATVVNPRHHAAALVELSPPVGDAISKMGLMKDGMPVAPTDILVDRSLLRGECAGFRIRDAAPMRCEFEQSLFAVGEWLLQADLPPLGMTPASRLTVSMNHITCLLGSGLYSATGGDDVTRRPWKAEFISRSSIFATGSKQPLFDQQLPMEQMDYREVFVWTGERNFFDDWDEFLAVRATGAADMPHWDFEAWCSFWGTGEALGSRNDPVRWARPWRERRWSEIATEDARLDAEAAANPPRDAAADGVDAGVAVEQLPREPGR
jgi:serine/threonine-protein kinase